MNVGGTSQTATKRKRRTSEASNRSPKSVSAISEPKRWQRSICRVCSKEAGGRWSNLLFSYAKETTVLNIFYYRLDERLPKRQEIWKGTLEWMRLDVQKKHRTKWKKHKEGIINIIILYSLHSVWRIIYPSGAMKNICGNKQKKRWQGFKGIR